MTVDFLIMNCGFFIVLLLCDVGIFYFLGFFSFSTSYYYYFPFLCMWVLRIKVDNLFHLKVYSLSYLDKTPQDYL